MRTGTDGQPIQRTAMIVNPFRSRTTRKLRWKSKKKNIRDRWLCCVVCDGKLKRSDDAELVGCGYKSLMGPFRCSRWTCYDCCDFIFFYEWKSIGQDTNDDDSPFVEIERRILMWWWGQFSNVHAITVAIEKMEKFFFIYFCFDSFVHWLYPNSLLNEWTDK